MSTPSATELLAWGDLDAKRRRKQRGLVGLLAWPPVLATIAALLLAADLWRRAHATDGNVGPIGFALIAVAFSQIMVVFATPTRMYWRHDSALLARLAIGGDALFELALRRGLRAMAVALIPAVAAVAVLASLSFDAGLRLGIVAVASAALAGLMAPAACLLGGAIVASDRAQAVIDSFAGEVKPPGTAWLGSLPGFVAMAVALIAMDASAWVAGAEPLVARPFIASAVAIGASIVVVVWAMRAAPRILISAQREVAALDQVRLAHIDRSTAGPLESVWAALTARGESTRLVYNKDAALLRRRYPAPYFVAFIGIVLSWILAAVDQPVAALVIVCSLAVYAVIMSRRGSLPPVEIGRLTRVLPLKVGSAARAKQSAAILRALVWVALPGAALVVFAEAPASAIALPAAALAFALVGGLAVALERNAS